MLLSFFIHSFLCLIHSYAFYFFCLLFCKEKRELCVCTRYEGSGGVAPRLLYLDTGGDWSNSRPFRFFFRKNVPGDNWLEAWSTPESALVICCSVETSLWAWPSGVWIPTGTNSFLVSTTSSSARGVKWHRLEGVHMPASSADVRND